MRPTAAHISPDDLQVFIQDDWQRDALVIQVRGPQPFGGVALGYAMEDMDGQPTLVMTPLTQDQVNAPHPPNPPSGLRMRHDMAVKVAQALIAHTKAPADPSEVAELQVRVANQRETIRNMDAATERLTAERDAARAEVVSLERLLEATQAHLDREARTADHFHRPVEVEQERQAHPPLTLADLTRKD